MDQAILQPGESWNMRPQGLTPWKGEALKTAPSIRPSAI